MKTQPDAMGHFGIYGGRYVAETLMPALLAVEESYAAAKGDPAFQAEFRRLLSEYVGRPSPLYRANISVRAVPLPAGSRVVEFVYEATPFWRGLVVSGGGTMNREAASLGVPVYSIFRGKIGAVDEHLSQQGRMVLIKAVRDVVSRMSLSTE